MDQDNQLNIDINSADEEALIQLQGVGTHLAGRIIEARPFAAIDDLTRVSGISENDLERLRPFLTISHPTAEDQESDEDLDNQQLNASGVIENSQMKETSSEIPSTDEVLPAPEVTDILDQPSMEVEDSEEIYETEDLEEKSDSFETETNEDEIYPELDQEPILEDQETPDDTSSELPTTQTNYMTRGGTCGLVLIGGFFTLIFAVAITLGILSSINRGRLNYASPGQVAALKSQTDTLTTQSQSLADDIDSLRTRMDNLESLSGQVSEMEAEISAMQEEIDELQAQMAANQAAFEDLAAQLDEIEEEIKNLQMQGDRFQNFLEGLRSLMEGLFPQASEAEETP